VQPGSRIAQKTATRERILEAALLVFSRSGFRGTKSSDIAAEARVAHGTVFLHFESQELLVAAAIERFGGRLARRLHELVGASIEAGRAGGGCLGPALAAHLEGLSEGEDFYARLLDELPGLPEDARLSFASIQSAISFHVAQAAERDIAAGLVREQPPHLLFNTWIGLLHHYLANRGLFAPGGSVLGRRGPELLAHFLFLVRVPGADGAGNGP
jgi:AcrR family transcriptional regulator